MQDQKTSELLLKIRGLTVTGRSDQGVATLIDSINLDLRRGEVLGLIGESGAGKSTLGLAAMGYRRDGCRIESGSVRFDGQELVGLDDASLNRLRSARIAYVAQSAAASFNPAWSLLRQTVEMPVLHGLMTREEAEAEAIALYEQLRLPDPGSIGFRYPHEVSGGQLQRAMTAMAMICKPELIIFDEPTTALDVTTQVEVLAAIRNIVREHGTAAIYISHDLAVVAQMADRIMVLRHGKLVEEEETRQMLANPREEYTRSLWAVREFRAPPKPHVGTDTVPCLSIRSIHASYGHVPVLHGVGFDVFPGRTTAIVGESGSGKSTLARVISGLLPQTAGSVLLNGEQLPPRYSRRSREELCKIQLIFQMADTALNPHKRVREIIGRPLQLYHGMRGKQREERVRELLSEIELDPEIHLDRYPGELSGGQKQRLAIARALAARPSLLICDEVTSALDQLVAEEMLKLLSRLQVQHGLTILFITHDLATVRAIADDVVVMKDGRVTEHGPKNKVFSPPYQPYTELLLSSVPEMDPDWLDRHLAQRGKTLATEIVEEK